MKTFLVSYDLRKPGQTYTKLHEALKSFNSFCRPLESVWVICSYNSSTQIRDHLRQFIDSNDKLTVFALSGEGAWYGIEPNCSAWLQQNL